jgi:hypothetical protein
MKPALSALADKIIFSKTNLQKSHASAAISKINQQPKTAELTKNQSISQAF